MPQVVFRAVHLPSYKELDAAGAFDEANQAIQLCANGCGRTMFPWEHRKSCELYAPPHPLPPRGVEKRLIEEIE